MAIRRRLIQWLGAVPNDEVRDRVIEVNLGPNDEPASASYGLASFGYKRRTTKSLRDFSTVSADKRIDVAWKLWCSSPLAKRILVMKRDHVVGDGIEPTSTDDTLAEFLDKFWTQNNLKENFKRFALQLFLFGEQCLTLHVRKSDGRVRLGYIDPGMIEDVILDPYDNMTPAIIVVNKGEALTADYDYFRCIRPDRDVVIEDDTDARVILSNYEGKYTTWEQSALAQWEIEYLAENDRDGFDGDVIFKAVNNVSNQGRGVSILIQMADFLDQTDSAIFALGDRLQYADFFSFDVTLDGATPEVIKERLSQIMANPPSKGSINAHNESEHWEMWAPNLRQGENIDSFRALLGYVLGGDGIPVHWYGFGDESNRATALAQNDPVSRTMRHDQGIVEDMAVTLCQFAIDQAEIAGELKESDALFDMRMPDLSSKDMHSVSSALTNAVSALSVAKSESLVSTPTARMVMNRFLAELGVDVDPALEAELIEKEEAEREKEKQQYVNGNGLNALGNVALINKMKSRGEQDFGPERSLRTEFPPTDK